jgi:enoyl-CoA hydratase
MASTLNLEVQDHIATVSVTSATMPPVFFQELRQAFRDIEDNSDVRAVVLRSTAKSFTYGLDLPATFKEHGSKFSGGGATERSALHAMIADLQDCLNIVDRCPVPVIAAIHGHCIGGGIDLITCCDIRLATSDSSFSVRETRIAIVADLGTLQRLPGIVGQGNARELAMRGCDISAERAAQIALVNHVYDDRDTLHKEAQAMAAEIASNPPLTVRGVKKVMDFSRDHGVQAGLGYVAAWNAAFLASEDLGEAMAAFMGKRPPVYKGR